MKVINEINWPFSAALSYRFFTPGSNRNVFEILTLFKESGGMCMADTGGLLRIIFKEALFFVGFFFFYDKRKNKN